ncbi:TPA: aliphatic sulfonates ABC transporter substrate-binding protein, partial [Bacillus anthracis]|nr:aliphatic sulfonates ABC transporter substrate-binding protein [Bacillus anthracis]
VWQDENLDEAIKIYTSAKKIDAEIVKEVFNHDKPILVPVTKEIVAEQQQTADFQYKLGSIKKEIKTDKVVDNSFVEKALKAN